MAEQAEADGRAILKEALHLHGWRRYDGGAELQRAVRLACEASVCVWDQEHAKHARRNQETADSAALAPLTGASG